MERPLYIPPNKKTTGLKVYCYKCKTDVTECKETGKPLQQCPFGERHAFKVYAHVPGTKNQRRTKKLETRDVNEAIKQAIEFEEEIKQGANQEIKVWDIEVVGQKVTTPVQEIKSENKNTPQLLTHALARYMGWLHGENVPAHRKPKGELSKEYLWDIASSFRLLANCLEQHGYDLESYRVNHINDEAVGYVYEELTAVKQYSGYTINRFLGYYKSFLSWYIDEYNVPTKNWFDGVTREKVHSNPESITREEYDALLGQITPENGVKVYTINQQKIERNMYRSWLKDGFRLGLETGRRREEVCKLLFNQIFEDGKGNAYIKIEDFKVNRIQKRQKESDKEYNYIPVTRSLRELLVELGYEKYKSSDKYILAPELEIDRKEVMPDLLSRAFSHYYDQLNTGKRLTYKCLRKTYITNLFIYMGHDVKAITGHANDATLERFYLDEKKIANAARNYDVWETPSREQQLEALREESDREVDQKEIAK